jgi:CheY-like chemotaxis protein
MKKILVAEDLNSLLKDKSSFLDRAGIKVFFASTNAEILKVHREEEVDLIITHLDLPGIRTEDLFNVIRQREELRHVSVIVICEDSLANRERCKRCGANAVFTLPVDIALLHIKAQQFLNVAPRRSYRAALAVAIQGKFQNRPLPFRTENISSSGMLIKAKEPLAKGDGIFFSFFLPDGTHVSGYGEIARVAQLATALDASFYGIRFTTIDPDVQTAIESVVKKKPDQA